MAKNDTHNVSIDVQMFKKAKSEDAAAMKALNNFRGNGANAESGVLLGSGDPQDLSAFLMSFNALLSTTKYPFRIGMCDPSELSDSSKIATHTAQPAAPRVSKAK